MRVVRVVGLGIRTLLGVFFALVAAGAALEGAILTATSGVAVALYATVNPARVTGKITGGYWLVFVFLLLASSRFPSSMREGKCSLKRAYSRLPVSFRRER